MPFDRESRPGLFDMTGGGRLEAKEGLDDAGLIAKVLPGAGEEDAGGLAGMEGALALDFIAEDAGFEGGDVHIFKVGEMEGGFRGRGKLRGWRGRHGEGQRFADSLAQNGARVETMAAGVLRGASLAGGGAGTAGPGAIEARGLTLKFRSHK